MGWTRERDHLNLLMDCLYKLLPLSFSFLWPSPWLDDIRVGHPWVRPSSAPDFQRVFTPALVKLVNGVCVYCQSLYSELHDLSRFYNILGSFQLVDFFPKHRLCQLSLEITEILNFAGGRCRYSGQSVVISLSLLFIDDIPPFRVWFILGTVIPILVCRKFSLLISCVQELYCAY